MHYLAQLDLYAGTQREADEPHAGQLCSCMIALPSTVLDPDSDSESESDASSLSA